jgi:hypothetical protein
MRWGMGLSKNRHGTYYAVKKVPPQLQEAVADVLENGKQRQVWLKRSLGTKDRSEANRRVKAVQIEFDRTLERAKDLLVERPLRDSLSEAEIKRIAEYHFAEMLHLDERETREGTGRDALMQSIASQLDAVVCNTQREFLSARTRPSTACHSLMCCGGLRTGNSKHLSSRPR